MKILLIITATRRCFKLLIIHLTYLLFFIFQILICSALRCAIDWLHCTVLCRSMPSVSVILVVIWWTVVKIYKLHL